jgi:hypothetical protein
MIIYILFMIISILVMYFSQNSFCVFLLGLFGFLISGILLLSILMGIG